MYEDNEQPVLRRILWIVLWLIIIVTIGWAAIWLALFRNDTANNGRLKSPSQQSQHATTHSPNTGKTTQSSGTTNNATTNTNNSSSNPAPSNVNNPTSTTSTTTSPTPPTLANTGAGDVFIPFMAATMAGSAIYYVRLRKRLLR
jgi:LPXTG-motif cell wall-anchored protein